MLKKQLAFPLRNAHMLFVDMPGAVIFDLCPEKEVGICTSLPITNISCTFGMQGRELILSARGPIPQPKILTTYISYPLMVSCRIGAQVDAYKSLSRYLTPTRDTDI